MWRLPHGHEDLLLIDATPHPHLPVLREPDHRAHGHGLRMIDTIAARWGTRSAADGKIVWAELNTAT